MDEVFSEIVNRGQTPTRPDIARLLASIAPPGEKRDEKLAAVSRLFEEVGASHTNLQGHTMLGSLESYEAW